MTKIVTLPKENQQTQMMTKIKDVLTDIKSGRQLLLLVFYIGVLQFSVRSQSNYQVIHSRMAEVKSKDLLNELDSVIAMESKCYYFNDSTMFRIRINQQSNFKEIKIGSFDNCRFMDWGYSFIYKNHLFQILSNNPSLDSNLYIATRYWMHYVINIEELNRVIGADDDSRCIFDYEYRDGIFIRKGTYLCE